MRPLGSSDALLPLLSTERLRLVHAAPGVEDDLVAFLRRNEDHFSRWDPPCPPEFYTRGYWAGRLEAMVADFYGDRAVRFHLHVGMGDIVGRIGFTQVHRGPFQSCMLGYQIDRALEGQGLMHEALSAAIAFMFDERGLHRIQANHLPENERSARLLARLGFRVEGRARRYLYINGAWRDHVMTALMREDTGRTPPAGASRHGWPEA